MRILLCLVALVAVSFLVSLASGRFAETPDALGMASALHVGLLMLAAWLAGRLFDLIRLPKISGYIALGILVGPFALGLIDKQALGSLGFINDLAVALVAITAGGEIRLNWIRDRLGKLGVLIGVDVAVILAVSTAALYFGRPLIPFMADETARTAFFIALLGGTIMIANSPTVVIAMISEYRARGPLAQTTLAFTVLKDLVLIVLFATVTSLTRGALDEQTQLSASFLVGVLVQLVGSVGLGAVIGVLMAWYVHRIGSHLVFFVVGSCLAIALIGEMVIHVADQKVHLEPLLMALSAGLLMQNVWPRRSEPLFHAIEEMSLPVYCLFFGLAGAKIDLMAFATMWYVALGLVALRAACVWAGVTAGCRLAGITGDWTGRLWLGMIPQAGVTLVLITLISRAFEADFGWGRELASILIAMLVVHEILGPIGFRWALVRSGEVGPHPAAGGGH